MTSFSVDIQTIISAGSGLLGVVAGSAIAFWIQSRSDKLNLKDSLDTKSRWREKLFEVASSEKLTLKEVYVLRAALRYKKRSEINLYTVFTSNSDTSSQYNFSNMTSTIIKFCDDIIDSQNEEIQSDDAESASTLTLNEQKKVRIYARYLLKYHWEVLGKELSTKEIEKQNDEWIKDTLEMVYKVDNSA